MADKSVGELIAAQSVTPTDLFVLEQNGTAKKLTGQILENWLVSFADGHGGIQSIEKVSTSGLVDTYRITLADTTHFDFFVTNGRDVVSITKTSTSGLVDTYTIRYNDGDTNTFTVTNGAKGDKGDQTYVWIKYASQKPTSSSVSLGDIPDEWIGIYTGTSATAPTSYSSYKWYQIKGEKGDTGDPAELLNSAVSYQVSDSGTIIPSGVWFASVPVVAQGKYLWTRTTNTFNTGSPVISYSVSRMGLDGSGSVSSVANISPDENGNVPMTAENIGALPNTGGDLTGELRMNGQPISGLNMPTANDQAANMGFVNQQMKKTEPRNLLDNSDFTNLVAQAGINGYHGSEKFQADRWAGHDSVSFTFHKGLGTDITFAVGGQIVVQAVSPERYTNIEGKDLTLAVEFVDGARKVWNATVPVGGGNVLWENTANVAYNIEYYPDDLGLRLRMFARDTVPATDSIRNMGLYLGKFTEETLPEYHPKGYDAELLACQTQLQRFRTESERKTYCEDFRPTMRMTPNGMVSKFEQEIDGVTYYFASAEL